MSSATMTSATITPQVGPVREVRDTMSISSLLTGDKDTSDKPTGDKTAAAPAVTDDARALAPMLSTPVKKAAPEEEDLLDSPDTVMSDGALAADIDDDDHDADGDDVPDSEREFICMYDENSRCMTGQYEMKYARKVISDHFGRNKACTRLLSGWPLLCRKHYQRGTYNKEFWPLKKLDHIYRMFDKIEAQFPNTTYDIFFKKSEEKRLNDYARGVTGGKTSEDAEAAVAPQDNKAFEAPIAILRELDLDTGKNKTMEECKIICERILEMLEAKETAQVPAIEFLPILGGIRSSPKKKVPKTPSKKDPETPSPKKAKTPKTPGSKKTPAKSTPGRVSAKGAVKKLGQ
jgi:hypothetical protein